MTKPLEGKIALVTGASRGIGRGVGEELADKGASIVVNYNASADAAAEVVKAIEAKGVKALAVQANVRNADEAQSLVEQAIARFGQIDILVNNAGLNRDRTIRRMTPGEWDEVIETDLSSMFYVTKACVDGMIERKYGRIVNMASIIGQMGNIGQANYAAAKAGMIGFTKSLAQELARYNITVNAMCPGFIETDMLSGVPEEPRKALLARIPLGRFGEVHEVASLIRYIVVEGDWITGQQFNVNGGMYM